MARLHVLLAPGGGELADQLLRLYQAVADARFIHDAGTGVAELFTQVVDVNTQSLGLTGLLRTPYLPDELILRDDAPGILSEDFQNGKLGGREFE